MQLGDRAVIAAIPLRRRAVYAIVHHAGHTRAERVGETYQRVGREWVRWYRPRRAGELYEMRPWTVDDGGRW